jgi:hypothetical protein
MHAMTVCVWAREGAPRFRKERAESAAAEILADRLGFGDYSVVANQSEYDRSATGFLTEHEASNYYVNVMYVDVMFTPTPGRQLQSHQPEHSGQRGARLGGWQPSLPAGIGLREGQSPGKRAAVPSNDEGGRDVREQADCQSVRTGSVR